MSETVHYKGVLEKINKKNGESLEEQCKRLLNDIELDSYYDSYQEKITELNGYYVYDNDLYKVHASELNPYDNIFTAKRNSLDNISFEVKYYNGGCGLAEAIDIALENMEEGGSD